MDDIVWEEPRPQQRGRGSDLWGDRFTILAEHEGEWAKFGPYKSANASTIRVHGSRIGLKVEAASRVEPDGIYLFVRVVGRL